MIGSPFFSIIIPVYNGGDQLRRCLTAIAQSDFTDWELIVVDDGSTDGSLALAQSFGAITLQTSGQLGPAAARNAGAHAARGSYLYFIDADCVIHSNTLAEIARIFQEHPDFDALFGAYDDTPAAANFVAQYKNLFHHYVHQNSNDNASTFWTGCGAIKRSQFLALGGFDAQRFTRPSVEDIDLGYRLKQNGGQIYLAKGVQVKHLKAWTLWSLIKSDVRDRGIPWTRLILKDKAFSSDLNLQTHNRVSVVASYGLLAASLALSIQPQSGFIAVGLALLLLWLNFPLYRFFYQKRGISFTLRVVPIHWLYYLYNGISFGVGLLLHWRDQISRDPLSAIKPMVDSVDSDRKG